MPPKAKAPAEDTNSTDTDDFQTAFSAQFPKLTALFERARANGDTPTTLRINSHSDGFRRAGIRHPFGVSDYPLDHFDPAQIEIMLDEPALTIALV
jgi:hypothetical protein